MGDKVPFSKGDLFRLKKWVAFELGFEAWLGLKEINFFFFFSGNARSKEGQGQAWGLGAAGWEKGLLAEGFLTSLRASIDASKTCSAWSLL